MKLWGGNYEGDPDRRFWEFNRSFPFDRRLLPFELQATRAWVRALGRAAALPPGDADRLTAAVDAVRQRAEEDPGFLDVDVEDVHSFVELRLGEQVGDLAGQAHLGRSRNEQTVTALRLWIRDRGRALEGALAALVGALCDRGEEGAEALMPGFTHIRAAEPITFGHLAGAWAWSFVRDRQRLADAARRADVLPLASGALAGTALPIDREALAAELGFAAVSENALDAVSDRDFAAEPGFACAQLQLHASRVAEDLIWLSGPEFGFFRLPEAYTTGSSLMPQKQNPDALELVRGKAGRACGDLQALLVLQKGLPAGYQKDLQEDKEALFDAVDTALVSVEVLTGVVRGLRLEREAMERAAGRPEMMAAGLAVALARAGMPFRRAHERVGALVAEAARSGRPLPEVAAERLAGESPGVAERLGAIFDPGSAVRERRARGGTAPEAVREGLDRARKAVAS
jgi:argininosuccinate lyase